MKPCAVCGTPSDGPRCEEHPKKRGERTKPAKRGDGVTAANRSPWKNLSRRLRKMQPFCSVPGCGNTDLTVDHITPLSRGGEPYALSNLQVLCQPHNSAKARGEGVPGMRSEAAGKAWTQLRMVPNKGENGSQEGEQ